MTINEPLPFDLDAVLLVVVFVVRAVLRAAFFCAVACVPRPMASTHTTQLNLLNCLIVFKVLRSVFRRIGQIIFSAEIITKPPGRRCSQARIAHDDRCIT